MFFELLVFGSDDSIVSSRMIENYKGQHFRSRVHFQSRKMKIFNFLVLPVLGRNIGYNLAPTLSRNRVPADKRDLLTNLTNMQHQLKKRIALYNSSKHGHKREINFDPALLGCEWGFRRAIACRSAQVLYENNHLATEGLVIDSETSH